MFWKKRIRELREELQRRQAAGEERPIWRVSISPLPPHEMSAEEAARYEARTGDLQSDEWDG